MISIIICGYNPDLSRRISENIEASCGVVYELLVVDNLQYKLPLTKAYNYGGSAAKFDFLVFVHEDVVFHTRNWGKILLNHFDATPNPGVFGVAGSSYLPISPSDWWVSDRQYLHTNFLSNSKGGTLGEGFLNRLGEQEPKKVFALDGMFLAMKKSVWKEFPFDESLNGFHGYDTSMCYQVIQRYHNYFVPGILLEHFSKGYPNSVWLKNTIEANRKVLPFILKLKFREGSDSTLERKAFHLFLGQLKKFGESRKVNISLAISYFSQLRKICFHWKLIPLLLKYLFVFAISFKPVGPATQDR